MSIPTLFSGNDFLPEALEQTLQSAVLGQSREQQAAAMEVINQFSAFPTAYQYVPAIMSSQGTSDQTKLFALGILCRAIDQKWTSFPPDAQDMIWGYCHEMLLFYVKSGNIPLVTKLDEAIISILKRDWPDKRPDFVSQMLKAALQSVSVAIASNTFALLRMLAEDVIFYGEETITMARRGLLTMAIRSSLPEIVEFCLGFLQVDADPALHGEILQVLQLLIPLMPLELIFQPCSAGVLAVVLATQLRLYQPATIVPLLQCLRGIAMHIELTQARRVNMGDRILTPTCILNCFVIPFENIRQATGKSYGLVNGASDQYVLTLAEYLSSTIIGSADVIEPFTPIEGALPPENVRALYLKAVGRMVKATRWRSDAVLRVTTQFWEKFGGHLYGLKAAGISPLARIMTRGQKEALLESLNGKLNKARLALVDRIGRPIEVLVVVDEKTGRVVRDRVRGEVSATTSYRIVGQALRKLTVLDPQETIALLQHRVDEICNREFTLENVNKISWSAGAIAKVGLSEDQQRDLVCRMLTPLLNSCRVRQSNDDRAVLASAVMYICSQYPRFLLRFWNFHSVVTEKLIDFCYETHPGVQDMACETLRTIAQQAGYSYTIYQPRVESGRLIHNELQPPWVQTFIHERLAVIAAKLNQQQVAVLYEALAYMIAQTRDDQLKQVLLRQLMANINTQWDMMQELAPPEVIIGRGAQGSTATKNISGRLADILSVNTHVFAAMGAASEPQFMYIWQRALAMYRWASSFVQTLVQKYNFTPEAAEVRSLRSVKRGVLLSLTAFVGGATPGTASNQFRLPADVVDRLNTNILPEFVSTVLRDYTDSIPQLRDHEVLLLLATLADQLGNSVSAFIHQALILIFGPTTQMIIEGNYPDIRNAFYWLTRSIATQCAAALAQLIPEQLVQFTHALTVGCTDASPDVALPASNALASCIEAFVTGPHNPAFIAGFIGAIYTDVLGSIIVALTDGQHTAMFAAHTRCLRALTLGLIQCQAANIHAVTITPSTQSLELENLSIFDRVRKFVTVVLCCHFSQCDPALVESYVSSVLIPTVVDGRTVVKPEDQFIQWTRDFMLATKQITTHQAEALNQIGEQQPDVNNN